MPTEHLDGHRQPHFPMTPYTRDTLFPEVLKFHLPDLCNHSLEHLKDFSSLIRIFYVIKVLGNWHQRFRLKFI